MSSRIALLLAVCGATSLAAQTCDSLAGLHLPNTTITMAAAVAAGAWPTTERGVSSPNPAFCRVAATIAPTPDSNIKIEVWMLFEGWNGKYEAVGNGGWSGAIEHGAMNRAIRNGYAVSSTDTGHSGSRASFAPGHPEKLIDYAYRSEHEMAVKAKAIIAAFYGRAARYSYWNGCSAGGKQGLKEAQRYPEDLDGIVAGSPAANWTGRAGQAIWAAQAVHRDPAAYIPPAKYPAIHTAALAACDALDGVVDGVIEDPRKCKFDPQVLECKQGDTVDCLTHSQVEAARKIYSWSINPRTKQRIYPGLYPGSELRWDVWGGPIPLTIALDYFRFVVFDDPKWDYLTLDFDLDIARAESLDHERIDALDPNLKPFFARGGKLIQYHGWNDPQISPGNSVEYYESVVRKLGTVQASYRLFMVPGMAHCGGGEGPNVFEMMPYLEQWVEEKKAPERVTAFRIERGQLERTRPLCPYPQTAIYKGSGSKDDQVNFVCK